MYSDVEKGHDSRVRQRFHAARSAGKRIRAAAQSAGLSEGAVMAAHVGEHEYQLKVQPLVGPWDALVKGLAQCGPLNASTGSTASYQDQACAYQQVLVDGDAASVLHNRLDLHLSLQYWHAGYVVSELAMGAVNPAALSLQFFDMHGDAVHKVFARTCTDHVAFRALVDKHLACNKRYVFSPRTSNAAVELPADFDSRAFVAAWGKMQHRQQCDPVLHQFKLKREQALSLLEGQFTRRLAPSCVRHVLFEASLEGIPLRVQVGNAGCGHVYTGPIKRVQPMVSSTSQWINVLDPEYSFHLREDLVATAWLVEVPTLDGICTSIEVYDYRHEPIAIFSGARNLGLNVQQAWRTVASGVPTLAQ